MMAGVKGLLVVLIIAVAIFLGVRWYKNKPASTGGGSNPSTIIVNPGGSFPNPYSS